MKQEVLSTSKSSSSLHHIACFTLATAACYFNCLGCGLVFDDNSAIKNNKDLKPTYPLVNILKNDFWGTPIHTERSHKSYRPVTVASFKINFLVHGEEPFGYHLINAVLHLFVCLLYYKLCVKFVRQKTAFLAVLLFAVHPIHTEAVTGVVGRAELLSAIFYLLAFITFLNTYTATKTNLPGLCGVVILSAAAMFSKEQGVMIIPLCILTDILILQKKKISSSQFSSLWRVLLNGRVLTLSTCLLSLCFLRAYIMHFTMPQFNRYDNPASESSTPTRQMTYCYMAAYNAWLMLFPSGLCCDWTMSSVPLVRSLFDLRNFFTALFFYSLYKFAKCTKVFDTHQRTSSIALLGMMMTVLPFLPASNLFFPVGFVIAERILYLPSLGFCLLVAFGFSNLQRVSHKRKKYLTALLFILLISHACKTIRRNFDWKNEEILYSSGLRVNPNNAKLLNNMGHILENSGKYHEAAKIYAKSIRIEPEDIGGYINIGRVYNLLNMPIEAENTLKKGKSLIYTAYDKNRLPINHLKVFITLANVISQNTSRLEEADQLYQEVIGLREDFVEAYLNRGDILIKLRRLNDAKITYEKALKFNMNMADLHYNLAIVCAQESDVLKALDHLNKALEIEPDHEPSLLNSALLIQEHQVSTETLTAYQRLLKLIQSRDSYDENVYFNLGMLSLTAGSSWNAEYWLRKAIQVKEDFKSALFNLALLLSDAERPLEAVTFINQLLKFHPNHTKALILMGDIYVNNMNDLESAEQCYKRILAIDPSDVQGLHNLCVIHYKRSKLLQAEKCLLQTLKLAPEKQYVHKHLELVRKELSTTSNNHQQIIEETDILGDHSLLSAFEYSPR